MVSALIVAVFLALCILTLGLTFFAGCARTGKGQSKSVKEGNRPQLLDLKSDHQLPLSIKVFCYLAQEISFHFSAVVGQYGNSLVTVFLL